MPYRTLITFFILAIGIAMVPSANAQLTSDRVPQYRIIPRAEQLRSDLEDSRYQLGPIRVQPKFALQDVGYNNNILGSWNQPPQSDWTATAIVGAHWTVPFGTSLFLTGDALPQYTWYARLSDRRHFGGDYSASAVALFSRMSLEATASTSNALAIVSSEIEAPVVRRAQDVVGRAEVDVAGRTSLYGEFETQRPRYGAQNLADALAVGAVGELNRRDSATRAGVRYRLAEFADLTLGVEQTRSEFDLRPLARDNTSRAAIVGLHYNRPRTYLNLSIARRQGRAANGSAFPEYDQTTGSYWLSYTLGAPIELQLFGERFVQYGLFAYNPWYLQSRNGLGVVGRVGNRVALRAFGELGDNHYSNRVIVNGTVLTRNDAARTWGGGVALRVAGDAALTFAVSRSNYSSNIPTYGRSITRFQAGISLTGDLPR